MKMELSYSIVLIVTVLDIIYGLKCRSCRGIIDPKYCAATTECSTGEQCYTEQVVDSSFTVFYNTGCKSSQLCDLAANTIIGKRFGNELHLCEKCCKYDNCNSDSCYHPNTTHVDECFVCPDVASPSECQTTSLCLPDETCFTQEFVNEKLEKRYRLGCERKKICDILHQLAPGRRSTQLCNQCCGNNGCNKYLCGAGNVAMTASSAATPKPTTQTPKPTTQTPKPTTPTQRATTPACVDSTIVKCAELDAQGTLCSGKNAAAATYCPNYCKLC